MAHNEKPDPGGTPSELEEEDPESKREDYSFQGNQESNSTNPASTEMKKDQQSAAGTCKQGKFIAETVRSLDNSGKGAKPKKTGKNKNKTPSDTTKQLDALQDGQADPVQTQPTTVLLEVGETKVYFNNFRKQSTEGSDDNDTGENGHKKSQAMAAQKRRLLPNPPQNGCTDSAVKPIPLPRKTKQTQNNDDVSEHGIDAVDKSLQGSNTERGDTGVTSKTEDKPDEIPKSDTVDAEQEQSSVQNDKMQKQTDQSLQGSNTKKDVTDETIKIEDEPHEVPESSTTGAEQEQSSVEIDHIETKKEGETKVSTGHVVKADNTKHAVSEPQRLNHHKTTTQHCQAIKYEAIMTKSEVQQGSTVGKMFRLSVNVTCNEDTSCSVTFLPLSFYCLMKIMFVCRNKEFLENRVCAFAERYRCSVSFDGTQLLLSFATKNFVSESDLQYLEECLLTGTDLMMLKIKLPEEADGHEVVNSIYEGGLEKDGQTVLNFDEAGRCVSLVFKRLDLQPVVELVKNVIKWELDETWTVKHELPWVFFVAFQKSDLQASVKRDTSCKQFHVENSDKEDKVIVTITGSSCSILSASKWLFAMKEKYGIRSVDFRNIPETPLFTQEHRFQLITEFLNSKFSSSEKTDVILNRQTMKVWVLSSESQPQADAVAHEILRYLKSNSIIVSESLPYSCSDFEEISRICLTEYNGNVIANTKDNEIIVSGLAVCVKNITERIRNTDNSNMAYTSKNDTSLRPVKEKFPVQSEKLCRFLLKTCTNSNLLVNSVKLAVDQDDPLSLELTGTPENVESCKRVLTDLMEQHTEVLATVALDRPEKLQELKTWVDRCQKNGDRNLDVAVRNDFPSPQALSDTVEGVSWQSFQGKHAFICAKVQASSIGWNLLLKPCEHILPQDKDMNERKKIFMIPVIGRFSSKAQLETAVNNSLDKANAPGMMHICIEALDKIDTSDPSNKRNDQHYLKLMFCTILRWLKTQKHPKVIIICCYTDILYRKCQEICKDGLPASEWNLVQEAPPEKRIKIQVLKDKLECVKVDAIVNVTTCDLLFNKESMSKALLDKAGNALDFELKRLFVAAPRCGDIVSTSAFGIKSCQYVIHGVLEAYKGTESLETLLKFVIDCLTEADLRKCATVAFPAVGTGYLKYPDKLVAHVMIHSVKVFQEKWNGITYLSEVSIIIPRENTELFQVFKKEEDNWNILHRCTPRHLRVNDILLQLDLGSVSYPGSDCLIYLWEKKNMHGGENTNIRYKELQTFGGNIPVPTIWHLPCDDSPHDILDKTALALRLVDKVKSIKTVCIGFDKNHPLLKHGIRLVSAIADAVLNFTTSKPNITVVKLLVPDSTSLECFRSYFAHINRQEKTAGRSNTTLQLPRKVTIEFEINGMKEYVDKALDDLGTQFAADIEPLQSEVAEHQIKPTESVSDISQNETDEDEYSSYEHISEGECETVKSKEIRWDRSQLKPWSGHKKYVVLSGIPATYSQSKLKVELETKNPKLCGDCKLVYLDNRDTALILCGSEADAREILQRKTLGSFQVSRIEREHLGNRELTIFEVPDRFQNNKTLFKQLLQHLEAHGMSVLGETPVRLKVPTRYQMEYLREMLHKFESSVRTVREPVSKLLWDIFTHTSGRKIDPDARMISYDEKSGTMTATITNESDARVWGKVQSFFQGFKDKELQEISVSPEHSDCAVDFCKECKSCFFIEEQHKLIFVSSSYTKFMEEKHQFELKTGVRKQTGRSKRHVASQNNSPRVTEDFGRKRRKRNEIKLETVAKNLVEFPCKNVRICIYVADILGLGVDCIVNAANERLRHGGGIAAVIEQAAGSLLTQEGDDYIKRNGPLQVGTACTTNAGNLLYDCVIHTVGPAWSDYKPHSFKNVRDCENHLYSAVYESFLCAQKKGCKSIALPAISSAIFRVPKDLCAYQYARATVDYCVNNAENEEALLEIHFVDKDSLMIEKIQAAFKGYIEGTLKYATEYFVISHTCRGGSDRHTQNYGFSATEKVTSLTVPIFKYGQNIGTEVTFLFSGENENQRLVISESDIFHSQSASIVVSVDEVGQGNAIARQLRKKLTYPNQYFDDLNQKKVSLRAGDLLDTGGYGSGYKKILHAVVPARRATEASLHKSISAIYSNVFRYLRSHQLPSVVTTLVGIDLTSEGQVITWCRTFLDCYLQHCKDVAVAHIVTPLVVTLVCREKTVYEETVSFFQQYVKNVTPKDIEESEEKLGEKKHDYSNRIVSDGEEAEGEENCVICMDTIKNKAVLECGHIFCKDCIKEQFKHKQACPTCGKVIGVITGNQPDGGDMCVTKNNTSHCAGFDYCGRIEITYRFPDGKQKENHPNPDRYYKGITRRAYLPDNKEGNEVLKLLQVAFKRKLVFTIGVSRTTGEDGVITWNDIHHKTDPNPGKQFGYPDPDYLKRVKEELAVKGVTIDDIQ